MEVVARNYILGPFLDEYEFGHVYTHVEGRFPVHDICFNGKSVKEVVNDKDIQAELVRRLTLMMRDGLDLDADQGMTLILVNELMSNVVHAAELHSIHDDKTMRIWHHLLKPCRPVVEPDEPQAVYLLYRDKLGNKNVKEGV